MLLILEVSESELDTIHAGVEHLHMDAQKKRAAAYNSGNAELYKTWGKIAEERKAVSRRIAAFMQSTDV